MKNNLKFIRTPKKILIYFFILGFFKPNILHVHKLQYFFKVLEKGIFYKKFIFEQQIIMILNKISLNYIHFMINFF